MTHITFQISSRLSKHLKPLPPVAELKFGQHFTDHIFTSEYSDDHGWYNHQIQPLSDLMLSPAASVLHYGQSLFEGMKAFKHHNGSIHLFRPEFNYQRMSHGAERLCMKVPDQQLFMSGLRELIQTDQRWIPSELGCSLYIRPTLIGTEGFLGVRPSSTYLFFIILSPVGSYFTSKNPTLKIWVEEKDLRAAPGGLGQVKASANYAASLRAAHKARERGFDQVLWLDAHHEGIEEVGTMNVFFSFKDEIVTPELTGSILPGNTRAAILELLRSQKRTVKERRITIHEVMSRAARGELIEAFGTGTAAVISPIGELAFQGKTLILSDSKVGPLSQELYNELTGIQMGTRPDRLHWTRSLESLGL